MLIGGKFIFLGFQIAWVIISFTLDFLLLFMLWWNIILSDIILIQNYLSSVTEARLDFVGIKVINLFLYYSMCSRIANLIAKRNNLALYCRSWVILNLFLKSMKFILISSLKLLSLRISVSFIPLWTRLLTILRIYRDYWAACVIYSLKFKENQWVNLNYLNS